MKRLQITERTWLEVEDSPEGPEGVLHVLAPEGHVVVDVVDVFLSIEKLHTRACEGSPEALRTYSRLVHQLRRSEREHEQADELVAVLSKNLLTRQVPLIRLTASGSAAEATATGGSPEIDIEQDGRSS